MYKMLTKLHKGNYSNKINTHVFVPILLFISKDKTFYTV